MGYALALTLVLAAVLMLSTIIQRALFKEERLD
jgi:multiple sugar transport system permease protein